MTHQQAIERRGVSILKGLAVLPVVLIHTMAAFPAWLYVDQPWSLGSVFIDQLGRYSVPLFIALSGYGLTKKHAYHSVPFTSYLVSRVTKLLPLYILWSWGLFIFLSSAPGWHSVGATTTFFDTLLWGSADYHLYFIPLILQLYLLFPSINKLSDNALKIAIAITGLVQFVAFGFLELLRTQTVVIENISPLIYFDQLQYLIAPSWLVYFLLGCWMARTQVQKSSLYERASEFGLGFSLIIATAQSLYLLQTETNVPVTTRFTRVAVLAYALIAVYWLLSKVNKIGEWQGKLSSLLKSLGDNSFLIYLSHTLIIRLVIGVYFKPLSSILWLEGVLFVGLLIWVSKLISGRESA
ncbi:MAG TPA: acyltransferase [Vitreimonas sp.]|nr:acyltransferase [Vitreimonas sp.]